MSPSVSMELKCHREPFECSEGDSKTSVLQVARGTEVVRIPFSDDSEGLSGILC